MSILNRIDDFIEYPTVALTWVRNSEPWRITNEAVVEVCACLITLRKDVCSRENTAKPPRNKN